MSRYGEFVRAFKEPEPVYSDKEVKDILFRYARCFISHIECPDGHWCFLYRDARTGQERESAEPRTYDGEDTACLRIKTGAQPVVGQPFGIFDYKMRGLPREDGEVIVETTGPEFSVWRGEVRFGGELDALFADLMMRVFEERYAAEGDEDGGE
jgi:hypothetical protein